MNGLVFWVSRQESQSAGVTGVRLGGRLHDMDVDLPTMEREPAQSSSVPALTEGFRGPAAVFG